MLKNVQLAAHFRLPPFPPSYLVLFFFVLNIVVACLSPYMMLFLLFSFVYGSLMLYRVHTTQMYLKITIIINMLAIWAYTNEVTITRSEQNLIFYTILLLYSRNLLLASVGVFKALFFMKPVEFDDVFWVIQFGSMADFFKYFMDLKLLRLVPSALRIIQNLRVGNKSAYISALRFVCHFVRQLLTTWSTEWLVLSIFVGLWEIYNNYVNQFGMERVFKNKGICLYPRPFLMAGFIFVSISQFAWSFAGKYGQVWTVIRKIIWNFLRVECRLADLYKKYAVIEIMSVSHLNDLSNIIY